MAIGLTIVDARPSLQRLPLPALAAAWAFVCAAPDLLAWYPVQVGYGLGLALVAVAAWEARAQRLRPPPALGLLVLFAVAVLASLAWSRDPAATRGVAGHVGAEVALLAVLAVTPRREALVRGLAIGAVVAALCVGLAFWSALFTEAAQGRRLHLWGGDGNHQARAVFLGLLLWLGLGRGHKPALLAGMLAMGAGLAGSRGAVLAGIGGLGLLAWRPSKGARPAALVAVLGAVLGLFLPAARGDLRSPVEGLSRGETEAITSGRDAIWPNALEIAADHPGLGVGAGAVPAVYTPYAEARERRGGATSKPGRDAHNLYLEVLASLGPVGLALLLGALGLAWRGVRSSGLRAGPPLVLFVALSALTVTTWQQKGWWLALGLAVLLSVGSEPSTWRWGQTPPLGGGVRPPDPASRGGARPATVGPCKASTGSSTPAPPPAAATPRSPTRS